MCYAIGGDSPDGLLDCCTTRAQNNAACAPVAGPLPRAFGHENDYPANRLVRPLRTRSALRRTAKVRDKSKDGGASLSDTAPVARNPRAVGDPGGASGEALGRRHVC